MTESNRRRNTRVIFHTTADLEMSGHSYQACGTDNLSISGVLLKGVSGPAPGDKGDLTLHLSGSTSNLQLNMKAEVIRCPAEGLALRFIEIDLDSYYHLKNIVYYNTDDPDGFNEDFPGHIPHPSDS